MRRQIAAAAAAFAMLLTAGCSSDPKPAPTSPPGQTAADGGSEVDRSSAESTALAFARMYAAGDLPHACELANDHGRLNIGSGCDSAQSWSTTVALVGQCTSGGRPAFHFEAAAGTINRNSDLVVKLAQDKGMWWVDVATTPASTETPIMTCDEASSLDSPSAKTSG